MASSDFEYGTNEYYHERVLEVEAVKGIHPDNNYWKQRCLVAEAWLQAVMNSNGPDETETEIAYRKFLSDNGHRE
jgi:hypothetical protein